MNGSTAPDCRRSQYRHLWVLVGHCCRWAWGKTRAAMYRSPAVQPDTTMKGCLPIRRTHTTCP